MPKQKNGNIWRRIERMEAEVSRWSPAMKSYLKKLSVDLLPECGNMTHARYKAYKRIKKEQ